MSIPQNLLLTRHSPVKNELLQYFGGSENLIFFDIGSCDGQDSVRYHRLFPQAQVFAFEPIPQNFQKITSLLIETNAVDKVKVFQVAMSNNTGTATMHVAAGAPEGFSSPQEFTSQSSSLLAPAKHIDLFPWCKFDNQIEVKTETIHHFCLDQKITKIDFIHLDVQGAELMVLKGAGDMINKISAIWLEVENVALYKDQPLRKNVEVFMKENNFVLIKFRTGGFSGDQFYIQKKFLQSKTSTLKLLLLQARGRYLTNPVHVMVNRIFRKMRFFFKIRV
jgi:FkbM family methyltransferase